MTWKLAIQCIAGVMWSTLMLVEHARAAMGEEFLFLIVVSMHTEGPLTYPHFEEPLSSLIMVF